MIAILFIGLLTTLLCLLLQAVALVQANHYFARAARRPSGRWPKFTIFRRLSGLMMVLMLGNFVQVAIWALLYRALGAFRDFETALYFSGVSFTSLGYGDVLLQGHLRLFGPLQAANGLMMFGITTAAFIGAVQRTAGERTDRHPAS